MENKMNLVLIQLTLNYYKIIYQNYLIMKNVQYLFMILKIKKEVMKQKK